MNEPRNSQESEIAAEEAANAETPSREKTPIPKLGEKPPPSPPSGPSTLRFTIRFLLFLMIVGAAYAFWVGINQRRTSEQLRLIQPLKDYGAKVQLYDGEVSKVSLRWDADKEAFDPTVLATLAKLPKLKRLVLLDTGGDSEMIAQIAEATSLEELLIFNANLQRADLAPLARLKSLRVLWLSGCGLNDEALDPLAEMSSLRRVNLNDNQLTDNGLLRLAPLVDLEVVNIADNDITDNGLNIVKETLLNTRIEREPISGYQP